VASRHGTGKQNISGDLITQFNHECRSETRLALQIDRTSETCRWKRLEEGIRERNNSFASNLLNFSFRCDQTVDVLRSRCRSECCSRPMLKPCVFGSAAMEEAYVVSLETSEPKVLLAAMV
jgi:hypothetical protein